MAMLLAWLVTSPLLPAQSLPPLSGVSVSLNTSSNRVEISPEALSNPRRNQLAAQIQLRNRSRSPLSYQFATVDDAQTKFTFSVFDSTDTVVWTGSGRLPARAAIAPTSTTQILRPGAAWTASVLIPLAPSGTWLPAGTYRIEAALAGTPSVFAATSFEVAAPPVIIVDPPVNAPTLVSGIDQVSAYLVTNADGAQVIRVSASGWMPHPGYTNARLAAPDIVPMIANTAGTGILFLDFTVTAPPPGRMYIMIISQVNATIDIPFNGQSSVTVRAASGSQSVEISDKPPVTNTSFPIHWGPPPAIQTKDIGELPGGYGMGSSTLATWIRRNMEADAANQPR